MMHLAKIIPAGALRGASLLALEGDRVWLGGKVIKGEGRDILALTGIGGRVEPGETFSECVLREVREETGTEARLTPCPRTLVVRGPEESSTAALAEGPAAVVFRSASASPGRPWAPGRLLAVAVFTGCLLDRPRPVEKLPLFVLLSAADILAVLEDRHTAGTLLAACPVVKAPHCGLDPGAPVRFVDSPEALFTHLGPRVATWLEVVRRWSAMI